jgi:hypothetical protein
VGVQQRTVLSRRMADRYEQGVGVRCCEWRMLFRIGPGRDERSGLKLTEQTRQVSARRTSVSRPLPLPLPLRQTDLGRDGAYSPRLKTRPCAALLCGRSTPAARSGILRNPYTCRSIRARLALGTTVAPKRVLVTAAVAVVVILLSVLLNMVKFYSLSPVAQQYAAEMALRGLERRICRVAAACHLQ